MSHYRKIDVRIWNDQKFARLSDDGQRLFLLLLTHPNMTALGAMRGSAIGLSDYTRWTAERTLEAFAEAFAENLVEQDPEGPLIALPNFLKYNRPESPNVLKSWVSGFEQLPPCELKTLTLHRVKALSEGMTKGFQEAFVKSFAKALAETSPNQKQKQKQKQQSLEASQGEGSQGLKVISGGAAA